MRLSKLVHYLILAAILTGVSTAPLFAGTTGIVAGVVTDSETGSKLAGVNIVIEGTDLTTVTDSNGYFVITNVPPGSYKVSAELVGYKSVVESDVLVTMDITTTVRYSMIQQVTQEEEATVIVPRKLVKSDIVPTLYIVDSKEEQWAKNQPNNLYQIPGIVSTQPGVTVDAGGVPHIRGGRENQIGYMLEGIPVTEPATYGFGTNTVTVGLSKMQIYTGGYRAEYGNAISGVFNEIKKTGSDAPGWRLELTGGSESFKGSYMELGGVTEGGLDYYVGSYLWQTNFEKMMVKKGESADTIGKFVYSPTEEDRLTLLINQGTAKYGMSSIHDMTDNAIAVPLEEDHNHQGYKILGLTWAHNFSPASFLTVRPYLFDSWNIVDALSPDIGFYTDTSSKQKGLQLEYTNQANEQHLVKIGGSIIKADNKYYGFMDGLQNYFDPSWGQYQYTSCVDTTQLGFFVQDQWKIGENWMAELGGRYDGMRFNKTVSPDSRESAWSPRLGLTYTPNSKGVWRASWGRFIQFAPTYMMDRNYTDPNWESYRSGDSSVMSERSRSFDIGYEHQFSDTTMGRITPFYRKYHNLLQTRRLNPAQPFPTEYYNAGEGSSKGIECYMSKKFSEDWEGWLSYTYMKAVANASDIGEITPGVSVPVNWDQKHTLQAVMNMKRDTWNHSLQIQYGSGLPYTGPEDALQNQQRVDGHIIFSLNTTKKLPKNSWLGEEIYLNIYNIFNTNAETHRSITFDDQYVPVGTEPDYWVQPRFITLGVVRRF